MSATALQLTTVEAMSVEDVRASFACWSDLLVALMRARREFLMLGETAQATALDADIVHLRQRAIRHLRRVQRASNDNGGGQ